MMVGLAMAIQENGTDSLDYFAMMRGWGSFEPPFVTSSVVERFLFCDSLLFSFFIAYYPKKLAFGRIGFFYGITSI